MMDAANGDAPITVLLESPADLLAVLPYLIGFHPVASLCVVALESGGAIRVLRCDLPDADSIGESSISLARTIVARPVETVFLAGYGSDHDVSPVIRAVVDALAIEGMPVDNAVRADQGRYWSYLCDDEGCCPAEGTPYDISTSAAAAAAVCNGMTALPDRSDLVASIAAEEGPARTAVREATSRVAEEVGQRIQDPGEVRRFIADVRRIVGGALESHDGGGRLDDEDVAWLSVLLGSIRLRDEAWVTIRPGYLIPQLSLWTDMTRRATANVAACASLLAFAAWQDGNGVLAKAALDRALEADPGYKLARLMAEVLSAGLPPTAGASMLTAEDLAASDPPDEV